MSIQNQTVKYQGKEVKLANTYIARNDSYLTIIDENGNYKLVRKDALLFNFNDEDTGYEDLMDKISKREQEISDDQKLMKAYSLMYYEQKELMEYNRNEKNKVLSNAGVTNVSELNSKDAERYEEFACKQSEATKSKNRACSDLLSKSIAVVSEILSTGKLKLQALMMRN